MKFSCLQDNLSRGLGIVGKAVARRSTLPVLSNVLLAAEDGRLKLSANNLEMGITCWVGARIDEPGSTTMPARLLTEFVNALPAEQIDLSLEDGSQTLNLRCAHFEANVKGIDAQEFPLVPVADEAEVTVSVPSEALRKTIAQVAFAAASDDSRPILTGLLARFEGNRLIMAAADGFRLSVRSMFLDSVVDGTVEIIIPARALGELASLLRDQPDPVQLMITPNRNQILFHMRDVDLVSQLVEGKFPDYRQSIPANHTTRTVMDTASFLNAVRVSHLFARHTADIVRIEIQPGEGSAPGRVTLQAVSAELGDNVSQLEALVEGDPIEIAFSTQYLADGLAVVDTAQVVLETTYPSSPGVIRMVGDEDFTHVIMPMHLG